jgi:hypothetical protein
MPAQHFSELIRDYGRSLLYPRHIPRAASPIAIPFEKGVLAARMGMEEDDNPYLPGSHDYSDWEAGYEASVEVAEAMDLE